MEEFEITSLGAIVTRRQVVATYASLRDVDAVIASNEGAIAQLNAQIAEIKLMRAALEEKGLRA